MTPSYRKILNTIVWKIRLLAIQLSILPALWLATLFINSNVSAHLDLGTVMSFEILRFLPYL